MTGGVLTVARSTFREAVRDRVMFLVVAFGAGVLVLSRVLAPLAMGEGGRVTVDLGLSTLGLLGLVIVALVGTGLVHKELERRTIYVVLTRPVSRAAYLIGKWLGLTVTMAVAVLAMGAILTAIAVASRGPAVIGPLTQAVVLLVCADAVLAALAVLFSSLSTPVLSTVYTLGLYATGYWTRDLRDFARGMPPGLADLMRTISYLVPNLDLFNLRSDVAQATVTSGLHMSLALLYAAMYITAALALAVVAFERRELK
jgi:ABC-type transport system involved in multi-copper enzyme maturation permease subunit